MTCYTVSSIFGKLFGDGDSRAGEVAQVEDVEMGGGGAFGEQDINCGGVRALRWAYALLRGGMMILDHNRELFTRFKMYGGKIIEKDSNDGC